MPCPRTPQHRKLRVELIRHWQPWTRSTGPRTPQGKAASSRNAFKVGTRPVLRALAALLRRVRT
jgi:hypothetical protein